MQAKAFTGEPLYTQSEINKFAGADEKGFLTGAKYIGILGSFGTVAGMILGPTTLGFNLVKDLLPNNTNAQELPDNPGGIPGYTVEKITGKDMKLLKEAGEVLLGASTSSNVVDAANVIPDAVDLTVEVIEEVKGNTENTNHSTTSNDIPKTDESNLKDED